MTVESSAIVRREPLLPVRGQHVTRAGLAWGALGVLAFSFTVPLTRIAVTEGMNPSFIAYGRAVLPAILAGALLLLTRQRLPRGTEWVSVAVVAAGCVLGFSVFTSLAAKTVPASHAAVVIGILPLATAAISVMRTGERPGARFWAASIAGALAVLAFVGSDEGGFGHLGHGDVLLLAAVVSAAAGYTEGGILARSLGGWQTICWALVLALPVTTTLFLTVGSDPTSGAANVTGKAIACFLYLALVSMFLGFFAWYRGLGIGPVAKVSQVQLLQPLLSIVWAALLAGERPGAAIFLGAIVVLMCAVTAVRARRR